MERRYFTSLGVLVGILVLFWGKDLQGQTVKEQTGPDVTVEYLSGETVVGELMAVRKDAFIVKSTLLETPVLKWSEVKAVRIEHAMKPGWLTAGGVAAGAITGALLFANTDPPVADLSGSAAGAIGGAVVGGLVAGLLAFNLAKDEEWDLQTMNDVELLMAKKELNGRSHYPDADDKSFAAAAGMSASGMTATESTGPVGMSDVDRNIPRTMTERTDAIAVVIGNAKYRKPSVPSVEYASRDAMLVKEYLIRMFGYREGNILFVENATQADFNSIFGTAANAKGKLNNYVKAGKSDVFVYYSGHGAPNPESKEGYFVPVDCDPALVSLNGYSLKTFYDNLSKLKYKSLTVVIDACFSGSSEKGMLLKNISPVFVEVEDPVLTLKEAVVMTSAAGNQVSSWYPEKGHSLFTYYFLKGIRGDADKAKDKTISTGELKEYLEENVSYMARRLSNREQTPQVYGNTGQAFAKLP
jgi:hypothetical protein